MVILVDFCSIDTIHFEINKFYLEVYKRILGYPVHLFAETKHASALHRVCPIDRQVHFSFYRPYSSNRIIRMYLREIATIVRLMRVIGYARKNRATLLHILNISHFSHNVARVMLKVLPPRCPVFLSIHDELESIAKKEPRFWKLPFWFPMSLNINVRGLYPIVLGHNIKAAMEKINPSASNWIAIEHPYTFSETLTQIHRRLPCLEVGTVGAASVSKGSEIIFKLAERFKEKILEKRISFKIIGRVDPSLNPYINPFVHFHDPQVFYDKETFDRDIHALSAVLYFYPEGSYQLTASGSIFDAIKFNKPIITTRNAYFAWILRDVPDGNVVWVENIDQIEQVLRQWLRYGPPTVDSAAYETIRVNHSTENVGAEFVKQLEEKCGPDLVRTR